MNADWWEYPQACVKCGHHDNCDKKQPLTILDHETKLCPMCFEDLVETKEVDIYGCHISHPCGRCNDCLMITR